MLLRGVAPGTNRSALKVGVWAFSKPIKGDVQRTAKIVNFFIASISSNIGRSRAILEAAVHLSNEEIFCLCVQIRHLSPEAVEAGVDCPEFRL